MPTIPIIESKVKEFKERFTLPDELGMPALYRMSPTEFGDEDMTESEDTKIARKMLQSLRQALLDVAQQVRLDTLEEVEKFVAKSKQERKEDPWAFGFNMEMTDGAVREDEYVLSHIASLKQQPL